ncbi:hypothetical protein HYW46_01860 [Candidatus Daviesbacteria bacterium]|nr:hypothetical protein [Candidatus Daviesbacteria bacterium]
MIKEQEQTSSNPTEARKWLRANNSNFATNRFNETVHEINMEANPLIFVQNLYAAGAVEVLVDKINDEPERIMDEGYPYAESLVVKLPPDPDKRKKLFDIFREEAFFESTVYEAHLLEEVKSLPKDQQKEQLDKIEESREEMEDNFAEQPWADYHDHGQDMVTLWWD